MIRLIYPRVDYKKLSIRLKKICESGILTQGENVKALEENLRKIVGTKFAFTTTSATTALQLSLAAYGITRGDEVLVADFTFPATGNVVVQMGAKPVLVDILLDDYTIDTKDLEEKITKKTKAIIPVDTFGFPCNMPEIIKIANKYNLRVIEDAACAIGAKIGSKPCGSFHGTGCFSFHPRKSITTGEGGLVTTNDSRLAKQISILRNHGGTYDKKRKYYSFIEAGFNYRLSELQAAVGLTQIPVLFPNITKRRKLAKRYSEIFSKFNVPIQIPKDKPGRKHTYQSYVVLLPKKANRDTIIKKMRQKGIETTLGTYALHDQPYYRKAFGYKSTDLPNSHIAFSRTLTLPLHDKLTPKQQYKIVKTLITLLRSYGYQ